MPTYIVLARMTQQGVQTATDIPKRRAAAAAAAEELGMKLREAYLTMGHYDVVLILDAPGGEAMAKFALNREVPIAVTQILAVSVDRLRRIQLVLRVKECCQRVAESRKIAAGQ